MAQQNLSEILMMDANNLVLLLNELEDEGLVRRVRDPADRRRHLVQVTEEGLARFDRARQARTVVEDEVLAPLSAGERDDLHRLLAKALGKQTSRRARLYDRRRLLRRPARGQPGCGVHRRRGGDGEVMQRTARELNLSETVFVLQADGDPGADARVRIFTPSVELPFAGHPVLGTAFVLGSARGLDTVRLRTGAGSCRSRCVGRARTSFTARWSSRSRGGRPSRPRASSCRRSAWPARDCPSRSTTTVHATRTSSCPTPTRLRPSRRICGRWPRWGRSGPAALPCSTMERGSRRGCSVRAWACPRTRRRARRPDHSPFTSLATAGSRSGRRSRFTRAPRSDGPRCSEPSAEGSADSVTRVVVGGGAVIVAQGEYRLS